jgi:hypothetical protein
MWGRQMNLVKLESALLFHVRRAKIAFPPILLALAFSSSPLSASILLGTALVNSDVEAETCFDSACTVREFTTANTSTASPESAAQTTSFLSKTTSISSRSEADILPTGGSVPNTFTSSAKAEVTLNYFFEVKGPESTSIPVLIAANGNIAVTGNFASTGYSEYLSEARLLIPVANQDIFIETGDPFGQSKVQTLSNSFSINGTFDLQTNTAYQVLMQANTGVDLVEQSGTTALADLIATASIDPSFQIGPGFSDYSIVFSDGIADPVAATPLPATFPLFAGGLGFVGYLARRKSRNTSALVAA